LHARDLLSLWLGRLKEEAVVKVPTKPFLFLLSEQKVRLNFVLAAEPGQKALFDLEI
jgi:hypothetical protein